MGGSGSGGNRVGSGRKPDPNSVRGRRRRARSAAAPAPGVLRAVGGNPDVRAPGSRLQAPASPLLKPPTGLSRDEGAVWRREAPRAIRRGTLVDENVGGFVELCELVALKAKLKRRKGGVASSVEILRQFVRIGQRVDQLYARFKLTAFGKADENAAPVSGKPAEASKPANPWAEVG